MRLVTCAQSHELLAAASMLACLSSPLHALNCTVRPAEDAAACAGARLSAAGPNGGSLCLCQPASSKQQQITRFPRDLHSSAAWHCRVSSFLPQPAMQEYGEPAGMCASSTSVLRLQVARLLIVQHASKPEATHVTRQHCSPAAHLLVKAVRGPGLEEASMHAWPGTAQFAPCRWMQNRPCLQAAQDFSMQCPLPSAPGSSQLCHDRQAAWAAGCCMELVPARACVWTGWQSMLAMMAC